MALWKMHLYTKKQQRYACGAQSGSWGRGAQPTCRVCKSLYTEARRHGDTDHDIRHEGITLPADVIASVVQSMKRPRRTAPKG